MQKISGNLQWRSIAARCSGKWLATEPCLTGGRTVAKKKAAKKKKKAGRKKKK
jgi:hypothetical protein